jgi:predicted transcriptional regulator
MTDTSNPTMTDADLAVLSALREGTVEATTLAEAAGLPRDVLEHRLTVLTDNGLIRETGAGLDLTDSGRQVLRTPSDGTRDDSLDAPPDVRRTLEERGLAADRLDAVLETFAFLRYWGRATGAELSDGVFSEVPLDFESADDWWREFVRDHLAALPHVDPPEEAGGFWRFDGTSGVSGLGGDVRLARAVRGADESTPYASATEALVDLNLSEDRRLALAAALAALQRGEREERALRRAATEGPGDPPDAWIEADLFAALERLPGVLREDGEWTYALTPAGYAAGVEDARD